MKTSFIHCTLLDGSREMLPRENMTIYVEDGVITGICEGGAADSAGAIIDLEGRYIMPGLINLHVHLPATGKPKKRQSDPKKLAQLVRRNKLVYAVAKEICRRSAKTQLYSGVTTIRTVGGVADIDSSLRDELSAPGAVGPRMLVSNMAVSVPGGHMAGSLAYEAHSAEEAAMYVRKIAEEKPDLIKLMVTGGVLDAEKRGEPGVLRMPQEYIRAACDAAHELGLKVAAHVESSEGVRAALEGGVDTIEHGAPLDDELIALFKKTGAALVCTLSPALPYAYFDRKITGVSEDDQYNGRVVMDGIIAAAKAAVKNGIPVGLGTDTGCPYCTHYGTWREIEWFSRYVGVSKTFALHTAMLGNAKILGLEDQIGTIRVGKCADMVVTEDDPLVDPAALSRPEYVIRAGLVIKQPEIRPYKAAEKQLDSWR